MKHFAAILLLALCATASSQTIKSLGYNTSNNVMVFAPTNTNAPLTMTNNLFFESGKFLRFSNATTGPYIGVLGGPNILTIKNGSTSIDVRTNDVNFYGPISFGVNVGLVWQGQTRTNLGLPWTGLTNTNADAFLTALRLGLNINATNLLPVTAATHLYDETGQQFSLKGDDGEFSTSASFVTTNAPTDTTNAVRWIILTEGTNSYRVPLFQ